MTDIHGKNNKKNHEMSRIFTFLNGPEYGDLESEEISEDQSLQNKILDHLWSST